MAIIQKRTPPASGAGLVGRAIRNLWRSSDQAFALGGVALNLSQPLPVYSLGLQDIHDVNSVSKAKPVGWRYLVADADAIAYADLIEGPGGEQAFSSLSRNRNAEKLSQAAHLAEKEASALPDCEARILDVPALQMAAIWLFGPSSKFIPYIDPEKIQRPDDPVSVDPDFLIRLVRRAKQLRQNLSGSQAG